MALVGRLPKLLFQTGDDIFVEGKTGTVFTVLDTLDVVLTKLNVKKSDISIGVMGIGFIGKETVKQFSLMGFASVAGFDTRFEHARAVENGVTTGNDALILGECDVLVMLTPRGDDISEYISHLKRGVIIIDDTHPFISLGNVRKIQSEKEGGF